MAVLNGKYTVAPTSLYNTQTHVISPDFSYFDIAECHFISFGMKFKIFCCITSTNIHLLYDWFQKWVKALESRTEKQNDLNEQFTSLHTGSCCPMSLCRHYPPWCCCSSRQSCGPLPVKYLTHIQISPNSDVF